MTKTRQKISSFDVFSRFFFQAKSADWHNFHFQNRKRVRRWEGIFGSNNITEKKTFRRMTNQFWILPQHDEYLSIVHTHTHTHTHPPPTGHIWHVRQFFTPNGQFLDPHPTYSKPRHHLSICTISAVHWIDGTHKGQLISEWNFGVFKYPKKPTKF